MAILKDIEVRIVATESQEPLTEYDNPESVGGSPNDNQVEKYIEAESGQQFEIHFYVKPGFEYYNADGLMIRFQIDQKTVNFGRYKAKGELQKLQTSGNPCVWKYFKCMTGTGYSKGGFCFTSLALNEDLDLGREVIDAQAETLGCIKVYISRVMRKRKAVPKQSRLASIGTRVAESSKEVVKKKHISHVVEYIEGVATKAPSLLLYDYIVLKEPNGIVADFTYRYRSYLNLQTLGCIPQSPSPMILSNMPPIQMTERQKVRELLRLRAEMEQLKCVIEEHKKTIQILSAEVTGLKADKAGLSQENTQLGEVRTKLAAFQALMGTVNTTPSPAPAPKPSRNIEARTSLAIKRNRIKEEDLESRSSKVTLKRAKTTVDLTDD